MAAVNAFVAHSFNKRDEQVVQAFLGFFKNMESFHPSFAWDTAKWAEPRPLTEKILDKFEGKNVFIAICSYSQRVISNEALHTVRLVRTYHYAETQQIKWKTSDWIMQEKGSRLRAIGSYQRPANALTGLFASGPLKAEPDEIIVVYSGRCLGAHFSGTVKRTKDGKSGLLEPGATEKVVGVLSDQKLAFMESPNAENPVFVELLRVAP